MYGTLRRALEVRGVTVAPEDYIATVEGRIEGVGHTIRITGINVHYEFPIQSGKREAAERALRVHPRGCPAHESVKEAIEITWSADIRDAAD